MPKVILIEHRDHSHSVRFTEERPEHSIFIRQWEYRELTTEQIEEIKNASIKQVAEILSKLYK